MSKNKEKKAETNDFAESKNSEEFSKCSEKKTDDKKSKDFSESKVVFESEKSVECLKKELVDYTDHLKRLQAEFENYIKRVEKERNDFIDFASEKILLKLLSVVDDIEHAEKQLGVLPEEIKKGVEMIFKKIHKILDDECVCRIECRGRKFDPFTQEVLMQVESNDVPEDTVVDEFQKGYLHKGRVIRYAKVKISKKPLEGEKNG